MERPRVWVIDNSPSIQETIAIVLGDEYHVRSLTADEFARNHSQGPAADLLLVGTDALPGAAVGLLPRDAPILWLQGPHTRPVVAASAAAVLPFPFHPEELRARIRALLSDRSAVAARWPAPTGLDYPLLTAEAAALARRAASTQLPVLLCGEPGTGKARLARALHASGAAAGDVGRFLAFTAATFTRPALQQAVGDTPTPLTIFLSEIAGLAADGEHLLRELIDAGGFPTGSGWHRARLICATTQRFPDLGAAPGISPEIYYRISVFPITLPPLRERTADIPHIVAHVAAALTRALSVEPVSFAPRAMERLQRYLWFGNLAELETVLARSIVLAGGRTLDVPDLLFGYGPLTSRPEEEHLVAATARTPVPGGEAVDLIINELAHEFKNPMVTIKTLAQHLDRLLANETGREQVARLTGEAVDRMDRSLENLLQFTRFRAPAPNTVTLSALLSPSLSELAPALSERRVLLQYRPPDAVSVYVDPEQISYAFENLLRTIVRDLQEGQTLTVRPADGATAMTFEFQGGAHPLGGRLAELLDRPEEETSSLLPLGLTFAKTLIERNGGRIDVRSVRDIHAVTVWLPSQEQIESGNGKTTNLDS